MAIPGQVLSVQVLHLSALSCRIYEGRTEDEVKMRTFCIIHFYRLYEQVRCHFNYIPLLFHIIRAASEAFRVIVSWERPIEVAVRFGRGSMAARLLESRVRIPPVAWMSVVCCQVQVSSTS